jgi:hypothetical protein
VGEAAKAVAHGLDQLNDEEVIFAVFGGDPAAQVPCLTEVFDADGDGRSADIIEH